jgi:hypothetical protein
MLMERCWFRANEVSYSGDAELRWSEKGECWFVELRGKNARGGEPKLATPGCQRTSRRTSDGSLANADGRRENSGSMPRSRAFLSIKPEKVPVDIYCI